MANVQHTFFGTAAPTAIPTSIGAHYIDIANRVVYQSVGISQVSDWANLSEGGMSEAAIQILITNAINTHKTDANAHPSYATNSATNTALSLKANLTDERFHTVQQINVKLNPGTGEYSSIAAALAAITDNSDTKRYLIKVGPGRYSENPLTMKSNVTVVGSGPDATVIDALNPNANLITLVNNSNIEDLTLNGATGSGFSAVYFQDGFEDLSTMASFLINIKFGSNSIGIKTVSTTKIASVYATNCRFGGTSIYDKGIVSTSTSGKMSRVTLRNCTTTGATAPTPTIFSEATGVGSEISFIACSFRVSPTTPSGIGVKLSDGALARILGTRFTGFAQAILTVNTGVAPTIRANGVELTSNTVDIQIDHPGTLGSYIGSYENTKVIINVNAPFSIFKKDLKVITVAKQGGDFTSVNAAASSIVGPSASNRYVISVGPGTYLEDKIVLGSYVSLQGESIQSVVLTPNNPADDFIVMAEGCELSFFSMQGAASSVGSGKAAIVATNAGNFSQYHKLSIYNFDYGVKAVKTSGNTNLLYLEYVDITAAVNAISNTNSFVQAENFYTYAYGSEITPQILNTGTEAELILHTAGLKGNGLNKGITNSDGAKLSTSAVFFYSFDQTIVVPNTGAAPSLHISASSFRSQNTILSILHAGTTGELDGYIDRSQVNIPVSAPFFITNKDPRILTVFKKGGDFSSVKAAMDSITDQSNINRYVISVGPGVFLENQIVGKEYVTVRGNGTTLSAINSSTPLILGADGFTIEHLTLTGVTSAGVPTVYFQSTGNSVGNIFSIRNVQYNVANVLLHVKGGTFPTIAFVCTPVLGGISTFDKGYVVENIGSATAQLTINSLVYQRASAPYPSTMFSVKGVGSELNLISAAGRQLVSSGTFIESEDGAIVHVNNVLLSGFDKGFHVKNLGAASVLRVGGVSTEYTGTYDLLIEHPGTSGVINGSFAKTKVAIDPAAPIGKTINFSSSETGGFIVSGKMFLGKQVSSVVDITDLVSSVPAMGIVEGGTLTAGTGFTVNVAAGFGYLMTAPSPTNDLVRFDWTAQTLTLSANVDVYIYINTTGILSSGSSRPSTPNNILLGRVVTTTLVVEAIDSVPMNARHNPNQVDSFFRDVVGSLFASGSTVSANMTARKLDITAGVYYFSGNKFQPIAGSAITWSKIIKNGSGSWTITAAQDALPNNKYDNASGTEATVTINYYTKHYLYSVGDGVNLKRYVILSQNQYLTLADAQSGTAPSVPAWFRDGVVKVASIIVKEGTATIVEIKDERPLFGVSSTAASSGGGVTSHGALTGLSNDDHAQYLLTNGSRALSGNLLMGGNSITGAGTVNGVTVEGHASRHTFSGTDAFTKGTPAELTDSTNVQGTDNTAFAAGNHTHSHGNRGGGLTHSAATTLVNGFMTASDKTKLDGIASAATANSSDSVLLNRSNHTGTQTASTISDFIAAASAASPVQSVAGRTGAVVLTKTDVGLSAIDNTSDVNKPVSTSQAAANSAVQAASIQRTNHTGTQLASTISDFVSAVTAAAPVQSVAGKTGAVALVKADVGLSAIDNTSDVNKPVSTAQASADTTVQNFSIQRANHTGTQLAATISNFATTASAAAPVQNVAGRTGAVVLTKTDVSLANVDNTADTNKPVSTAQAAANTSVQAFAIQRTNHTGTQLAATISDFAATASSASPVQSVAGRTGAVVLTKTDVSLGNVVNFDTSTTLNITDSLNKRFVTDAQKAQIGQAAPTNYSNVNSATNVTTSVNTSPSIMSLMTLAPVAGTHRVTFNGQYSTTAASMTAQASSDLSTGYNTMMALAATGTHVLVFGPETITPGVYDIAGAGSITTAITVTLDGQGNPNSLFIFRNSGAFSTGASCVVSLINGAQASNVFWIASGAITLGANTDLTGTLLSLVAVSCAAGCIVKGRLSSTGGAVGIATTSVTKPATASQINLGTFAGFAMFTSAGGASAAGVCTVTGDVGTNAGAITGFESTAMTGNFYTSASISSVFTLSIYNNGVLVPNSSRSIIAAQSTGADVAILDAIVTTTAGQSIDIRVKIDSGSFTTGNRNFTTVQLG